MGFFDSFKTGLAGFGDFLGDITGAALAAAPTVIPILQSTGVIPQIQQSQPVMGRGPARNRFGQVVLPGGARTPFPQAPQLNTFSQANVPLARPVGFPTGRPSMAPSAPAGVVPMPTFQSGRGGLTPALFQEGGGFMDTPLIDTLFGGGNGGAGCPTSPWKQTQCGARSQAFLAANPTTGKTTWFKPAGQPILWSGDLTACRRVDKVARRARRVSRKR